VTTTIIFLLLLFSIIGLLAWGGISIVEQIQNLITFFQNLLADLPGIF
jgi:predicted PurR-regulated permease PerM